MKKTSTIIVTVIFVVLPLLLMAYKVMVLDFQTTDLLPQTEYTVRLDIKMDAHLGKGRVKTYLPISDGHQKIFSEEQNSNPAFRYSSRFENRNRIGEWSGSSVPNQTQVRYSFKVITSAQQFEIAPNLEVPSSYPSSFTADLVPTKYVQVDDPEIVELLKTLGADKGFLIERLRKIYDFTSSLGSRPFKGTTDALTALRLGEASCNGKSRLFVALARAAGMPARLVGGLILKNSKKRTSHQWLEVYVGGHWVPFCPTNKYFSMIPSHYLVLYRGDEVLFRHTSDTNFDYSFTTTSRLVPSERSRTIFKSFNLWELFARLKLPFTLLRTVLMLPIGALVVVLFRNVVGVPTFGTFLPALIAAAATATGLFWGMVSLIIVLIAVVFARLLISKLKLLHSPTLAILLAVVVMTMLTTSLAADRLELSSLARITYFPIAVMAIASERFYLAFVEQGVGPAVKQLTGTLVVVLGCYVVMNSLAIQMLVSGFPEVMLLVIAADIYLGRWVGVRFSEYWRFRPILGKNNAA